MHRKSCSVGVLIAVIALSFGGMASEARDRSCRQGNWAYSQSGNGTPYDTGFNGITHGKPWGEAGMFGRRHGNTTCQQPGYYGGQPYGSYSAQPYYAAPSQTFTPAPAAQVSPPTPIAK